MSTVYDPARGWAVADDEVPGNDVRAEVSTSLEDLRAAVEQSEQVAAVEFADLNLEGPGGHIRLVCSTELSQDDLKRAQRAGLPPDQRKKRMPDVRKLNEVIAFATLISWQTKKVELRCADGTYRAVPGDLSDPTLLTQLGVMDPVMGVQRIFGNKDAYIMRAGQELMEACGYGERKPGEPGDDEDPT